MKQGIFAPAHLLWQGQGGWDHTLHKQMGRSQWHLMTFAIRLTSNISKVICLLSLLFTIASKNWNYGLQSKTKNAAPMRFSRSLVVQNLHYPRQIQGSRRLGNDVQGFQDSEGNGCNACAVSNVCHVMLVATMARRNVSASHTSFIIPSTIQSLITTLIWFWFAFLTHFWGASWWASKRTAMPATKRCVSFFHLSMFSIHLSTWSFNLKFSFIWCQSHSVKKCGSGSMPASLVASRSSLTPRPYNMQEWSTSLPLASFISKSKNTLKHDQYHISISLVISCHGKSSEQMVWCDIISNQSTYFLKLFHMILWTHSKLNTIMRFQHIYHISEFGAPKPRCSGHGSSK